MGYRKRKGGFRKSRAGKRGRIRAYSGGKAKRLRNYHSSRGGIRM